MKKNKNRGAGTEPTTRRGGGKERGEEEEEEKSPSYTTPSRWNRRGSRSHRAKGGGVSRNGGMGREVTDGRDRVGPGGVGISPR